MRQKIIIPFFTLLVALPLLAGSGSATAHSEPHLRLQIDSFHNRLTVLENGTPVKTYRIALGRPETPTPVGEWRVINKHKNWGSGFGTRWIGLNVPWGLYGIHGTNRPGSIGYDLSHGCVRMLNREVEELFEIIPVGTPVVIIGHPLREPYLNPRRLAKGDSGSDVQLIQSRLKSEGLFVGACNGKFGSATEQAMKRFERDHGLPVDGVVSMHDYAAMSLVE